MEEKLRAYMDSVFRDVSPSRQSIELKEEILQNLVDKYHDMIGEGKTPEAAYNIAVASVGDIDELLAGMQKRETAESPISREELEQQRRKSGLLVAIAVVMYICSILPPILLSQTAVGNTLGPAMMFILIAAATGILIYNYMTRPQYSYQEDSIVGDFREWQKQTEANRRAFKALSGALWSLTVVIYMLVSFATMSWHITWVIFLIAAALEGILKAVFELKGK